MREDEAKWDRREVNKRICMNHTGIYVHVNKNIYIRPQTSNVYFTFQKYCVKTKHERQIKTNERYIFVSLIENLFFNFLNCKFIYL